MQRIAQTFNYLSIYLCSNDIQNLAYQKFLILKFKDLKKWIINIELMRLEFLFLYNRYKLDKCTIIFLWYVKEL